MAGLHPGQRRSRLRTRRLTGARRALPLRSSLPWIHLACLHGRPVFFWPVGACQHEKTGPAPEVRTRGSGAADEIRTHDIHLGKVVLYQLSYARFEKNGVNFQPQKRLSTALFIIPPTTIHFPMPCLIEKNQLPANQTLG